MTATLDVQELNPTWARQNGQAATGRLEHPYAFLPAASGSALGVQRQPFLAIGGSTSTPRRTGRHRSVLEARACRCELTVVADPVLFKRHADSFGQFFTSRANTGDPVHSCI